MQQQVIFIHGGETFATYEEYLDFLQQYPVQVSSETSKRWREKLPELLGPGFEVFLPMMPNKYNARYAEWKIWFEKYLPALRDGVVLVGYSLGGIFLAKYLSEERMPIQIRATLLLAAPHDDEGMPYSLVDFVLPQSLTLLEDQGGHIVLMHSEDDPVVPFRDHERYRERLKNAECVTFIDRGHFLNDSFPELIEKIKEVSHAS